MRVIHFVHTDSALTVQPIVISTYSNIECFEKSIYIQIYVSITSDASGAFGSGRISSNAGPPGGALIDTCHKTVSSGKTE